MLIFPITKAVDAERRVFARLDEKLDRQGEALDYAASKPVFKAWSDSQAVASGGASLGNIRGQHNGRIAAGRVTNLEFDDVTKTIGFEIEVVDPDEWEKVCKGVYTGISPGGKGKRYVDAQGMRRVAMIAVNEVSLVDYPAQPDATFTVVKADGVEAETGFAPPAVAFDVSVSVVVLKALAETNSRLEYDAVLMPLAADDVAKCVGDLDLPGATWLASADARRTSAAIGEAMPDGSYPIQEQADLDAAALAVEKAGASEAVLAHLQRRAAELELTVPAALAPASTNPATEVRKGMGSVSRFTSLIEQLTWLATDVASEAALEQDGSTLPAQLTAWLQQGAQILLAMAGEETSEVLSGLQSAVASLPSAPPDESVAKSADAMRAQNHLLFRITADLAKTRADLRASQDEVLKATASYAGMREQLDVLKAQPAPGGARLRNITRGQDGGMPAPDPLAAINAMPDGPAKARALLVHHLSGASPAAQS